MGGIYTVKGPGGLLKMVDGVDVDKMVQQMNNNNKMFATTSPPLSNSSSTIILPLPKLNSPTINQYNPPHIHHHNSLWDYKFTATTSSSTENNSSTTSPSPPPVSDPQLHSNYTLQTPIPQQPLLLPSIATLPPATNNSTNYISPSITPPSSRSQSLPTSKIIKPQRKKKQCPECHLFFSNLSTHKSIHLTPENRPYLCKICGRGFARSNDLFRHNKRHWKETGSSQGAFKCPFSSVLYSNTTGLKLRETPCHPTGIFSRCDTYKNHLKALHFEYPPGTKKKNRMDVGGNCKKCGKFFENVEVWLNTHVENNECGWHFE